MSYNDKVEFLEAYRKLCQKYKLYIDTGFRQPMYVMSIMYPVDDDFEKTMTKLWEDIG
jgi:hypothetical protein